MPNGFDPDKYLAKKKQSIAPFDPDAYLAKKKAPQPRQPLVTPELAQAGQRIQDIALQKPSIDLFKRGAAEISGGMQDEKGNVLVQGGHPLAGFLDYLNAIGTGVYSPFGIAAEGFKAAGEMPKTPPGPEAGIPFAG